MKFDKFEYWERVGSNGKWRRIRQCFHFLWFSWAPLNHLRSLLFIPHAAHFNGQGGHVEHMKGVDGKGSSRFHDETPCEFKWCFILALGHLANQPMLGPKLRVHFLLWRLHQAVEVILSETFIWSKYKLSSVHSAPQHTWVACAATCIVRCPLWSSCAGWEHEDFFIFFWCLHCRMQFGYPVLGG